MTTEQEILPVTTPRCTPCRTGDHMTQATQCPDGAVCPGRWDRWANLHHQNHFPVKLPADCHLLPHHPHPRPPLHPHLRHHHLPPLLPHCLHLSKYTQCYRQSSWSIKDVMASDWPDLCTCSCILTASCHAYRCYWLGCTTVIKQSAATEDVPLRQLVYLVFTHIPCEIYHR